ncbi:MAG: hypothetical protein ACE5NG_19835 [bacterium]
MAEIKNASQATEKALSFLLEKYPMRGKVARPLKAVHENNFWVVEFNVGIVRVMVATIKIDRSTGEVIEYNIPPVARTEACL